MHPMDDGEILRKYRDSGDKELVGKLYVKYSHLVLGVCMKYLKDEEKARDAVMQIFEKLMTDLLSNEVQNFKSWLYTVSKNHCLMALRSEKTRRKHEEGYEIERSLIMEFEDSTHLNGVMEKEERLQLLEKGIEELGEEQRKCVQLFYIDDKSYNEIAEMTGYSMKQVKSYIQNGKRNLGIYLKDSISNKGE